MHAKPRIYLAGPLGFTEAGRHFHASVLVPYISSLGYQIIDPWTLTDPDMIERARAMAPGPERREAWERLNRAIAANNCAAIDSAEGVVAVLDGSDVDSGTAAEIGYAFARGKFIVGYRGDSRQGADNEGSIVNLQVEFFIRESGGAIVSRYEDLAPSLQACRSNRA